MKNLYEGGQFAYDGWVCTDDEILMKSSTNQGLMARISLSRKLRGGAKYSRLLRRAR